MITNQNIIELGDICLEVSQKDIKNVHLSVHPPKGRVTVAAPLSMDLETIRLFTISKLNWIRKQQTKLINQKRESIREYVTRESHYFLGKRYLLKVVEEKLKPKIVLKHSSIELHIKPKATRNQKELLVNRWYKNQLKEIISPLITKYEKILKVKVKKVQVRNMKTMWGNCHVEDKTIVLNTELAKKSIESIEYIVVHEMNHLLERNHNDKYIKYMNKFLPKWRHLRTELNRSALGHVEWSY